MLSVFIVCFSFLLPILGNRVYFCQL